MMNFKLDENVVVINDGVGVDIIEEMIDSVGDGVVRVVSVEKGFEELDNYFENYVDNCEENKISYEELSRYFKENVVGGKLYLWNIEYDLNLMWIGDDEKVDIL